MIMADSETEEFAKKSKQVEAERIKAAQDLTKRDTDKTNLAYMPITKSAGYSRDPNIFIKNAERMANISVIFTLLGIVFGIFITIFNIAAEVNHLGLAGAGIAMVLSVVNGVGIGVGALTGIVALGCSIVFSRRTKIKVKPIIITAGVSLALISIYYIVLHLITH